MWPTLLLGLLVASLIGWIWTWLAQVQRIRQLERSKEEIQVEETLVFDFLHGLGSAFTETTIRAADLHRLIVEGASRILDAHGGALYMVDRTGAKLAPAIFRSCPPLVEGAAAHTANRRRPRPSRSKVSAHARSRWSRRDHWPRLGKAGGFFLTDGTQAPELEKLRGTTLGTTSVR